MSSTYYLLLLLSSVTWLVVAGATSQNSTVWKYLTNGFFVSNSDLTTINPVLEEYENAMMTRMMLMKKKKKTPSKKEKVMRII